MRVRACVCVWMRVRARALKRERDGGREKNGRAVLGGAGARGLKPPAAPRENEVFHMHARQLTVS